jgi:hypothetical protein
VAAEFPQLCEEETAAFSKILGTHVQRLATIAHGDGVCTTFIPQIARQNGREKKKENLVKSSVKTTSKRKLSTR